jgi:hypothetical protein
MRSRCPTHRCDRLRGGRLVAGRVLGRAAEQAAQTPRVAQRRWRVLQFRTRLRGTKTHVSLFYQNKKIYNCCFNFNFINQSFTNLFKSKLAVFVRGGQIIGTLCRLPRRHDSIALKA